MARRYTMCDICGKKIYEGDDIIFHRGETVACCSTRCYAYYADIEILELCEDMLDNKGIILKIEEEEE